jgi:hypothetical protein
MSTKRAARRHGHKNPITVTYVLKRFLKENRYVHVDPNTVTVTEWWYRLKKGATPGPGVKARIEIRDTKCPLDPRYQITKIMEKRDYKEEKRAFEQRRFVKLHPALCVSE